MERSTSQAAPGAGYLCFQTVSEGAEEWAALLVVTPDGLPLEFLYSGPLRPTPVQEILYQERLAEEVRLALVRSLLRGLRSRLAFVAASAADLTPALPEELKAPVLALEGESAAWIVEPAPLAETMRARLESLVGAAEPLGRARAALAYVVAYEQSRRAEGRDEGA